MAILGKTNHLEIIKAIDQGVMLEGGHLGHILLPNKFLPKDYSIGEKLTVFLYLDTNDEPIATTQTAKITLGECAFLKVVDVNKYGAFFDWGLPKDLMVPYAEQSYKIYHDLYYTVFMYQDNATKRLVGSIKLSKHLNEFNTDFKPQQQVDLLICGKSGLGFKAVVNKTHLGLIHHSDVFKTIRLGQKLQGYIKEIRADKKINLSFTLPDAQQLGGLAAKILQDLRQNDGQSNITDKTPPAVIYQRWNVSKGSYKKALGSLYKQKLITITATEIKLK
ncbi:MAG: S1-like domain-containing RNA-binding protein [Proteobacteria bacterium]|nr:S1-like domain-containing RNA-binding protein [Pseudomonadota bacterium]